MKKMCNACWLPRPLSAFHRRRNGQPLSRCKGCLKEQREENRDRDNAARRLLRRMRGDEHREQARRYAATRRKTNRLRCRAWRAANRDKQQSATKRWKEANRDRVRHHNAHRAARAAGAVGKFTFEEWTAKCDKYDRRCAYCRKRRKLTRHHVVPLAKGGHNRISNVVPACQSCNSRIGTKVIRPKKGVALWA
jgi:5-methylcytosine-specific restriction endonuclease McrA